MLAAAMEGWDYPFPRDLAALADLIDLQYAKTGSKKKYTYPRPFKTDLQVQKFGNAAGRSRAEVLELLAGMGHAPPV